MWMQCEAPRSEHARRIQYTVSVEATKATKQCAACVCPIKVHPFFAYCIGKGIAFFLNFSKNEHFKKNKSIFFVAGIVR